MNANLSSVSTVYRRFITYGRDGTALPGTRDRVVWRQQTLLRPGAKAPSTGAGIGSVHAQTHKARSSGRARSLKSP